MIVLTRTECQQARTAVQQVAERDEISPHWTSTLLSIIHDKIERIVAEPMTTIDTRN